MKNQIQEYMSLAKSFMKKNYLLFLSLKVLKILLVLMFFSCENKQAPVKIPDTVKVDTINGNAPEDSILYRNNEEDEEEEEEQNQNPIVPEES